MLNLKKYLRSEKGFTMIEMMVVLIIIAVLIAGGIKFYSGYIGKSRITKATAEISTIQAALDSYYAEKNAYPDASKLEDAGIDTSIIGSSDENKKYEYTPTGTPLTSYTIITRDVLDGTHKVQGKGANGTSSEPELITP